MENACVHSLQLESAVPEYNEHVDTEFFLGLPQHYDKNLYRIDKDESGASLKFNTANGPVMDDSSTTYDNTFHASLLQEQHVSTGKGQTPILLKSGSSYKQANHITHVDEFNVDLNTCSTQSHNFTNTLQHASKKTQLIPNDENICVDQSCVDQNEVEVGSSDWQRIYDAQIKHRQQSQQVQEGFAAVMRTNGVRRENARKNIGKPVFAFNALQRNMLPYLYQPPPHVGGGKYS
jgi:hypothetical protein